MSRFRSLMGAAGAAGAGIASKYVDDEIATNRSKMLAELTRQNAGLMREDEAAFSDKRAPVERERKRADMLAAGATTREVELAGLQDPALRGARRQAADETFDDETGRKVRGAKALMPVEAEREGLMAEARAKAAAKYREPREPRQDGMAALNAKLAAIDKMDFLSAEEKAAAKKALVGVGAKTPKGNRRITIERDDEGHETGRTIEELPPGTPPGKTEDPVRAAMLAARAAKAGAKPGAPPAAAAATPPPAPAALAPSQPADPLAGKSRSQIREIESQLRSELTRWQGRPGAERRAQEIEALLERIATGQY